MEGIDPITVAMACCGLVVGLMVIVQITNWLFHHLWKLSAVIRAAGSFQIPIYILLAVPFFYLFLLPVIRYLVPEATVETEAERPSRNLGPELSDEQRAEEARRCRLPGPACETVRYQLEIKKREVNDLVRQLGQTEQRELDAVDAAEAERNSHKVIRRRLDRTEQQLVRYEPEANSIRQLETLLAESETRVVEANKRTEKADQLLKTEVEHSKWVVEQNEAKIRKLRDELKNTVMTARDRIGVLRSEVASLKGKLDAATRKDMSADVEALLAEKDATIQFLTEAGLAVENDRTEKMAYAETMYALLETENQKLQQQLSESTKQAPRYDAEVCSLRDALGNAQAQIQTAEAVFYDKEKKIEDLKNQLKKVTDDSKMAVAHANDQVSILKAKLSNAQEQVVPGVTKESIEGLNRELEELRNHIKAAEASHASKMNQASAIHTEQQQCIESLRNNMNAASLENTNMRQETSRLQEMLSQHAVSNTNIAAIEQRIAAMQHQHQTDMNQAKSVLEAKDGEIKHLQDSLVGTRNHIETLKEEVAEMEECIEEQDTDNDRLTQKLRDALVNEKNAIKRVADLEDKRKKEAAADLLKYNRLKVEFNKATQERDNLLDGNQTAETKRLTDQLAEAQSQIVTRDQQLRELKKKVAPMTSKTRTEHAGANTRTGSQNYPKTPQAETQLYTPETRRKQQKALEIIERVQLAEGIKDDDADRQAQSDEEMETESTQAHHVPDAETDNGKQKGKVAQDEEFEAALNEAIDESNREYSERTCATFTAAIQAPGVANPFATPGPPTTAPDFSTLFGRQGAIAKLGQQTVRPSSPEKPSTPESATERHLKSGVAFWVPQKKTAAGTSTPQQRNADGQEAPDTPAPITGRMLKKPVTRRRQQAKEQGDA